MKIENINKGWKFYKEASGVEDLANAVSVGVNLPHTWNNIDGQDGGNDYYRGTCYYEKIIDLNKKEGREYYLEFKGVNSVAKVYVNGKFMCEHAGGFSTFRCNVTDALAKGENTILVSADNSPSDEIYPQTADFTFFGGIYRDVNFIEVGESRFDLDYYGSEGVMVTPIYKDGKANITIESYITNPKPGQSIKVDIVFDGDVVASKTTAVADTKCEFELDDPKLWKGVSEANLYTAKVTLLDGESELDSRDITFGVRSFSVDKDGFYLNGAKYDLHGVSRHQDRLNKGWAISKADHEEDMALIREMGATSIRLAHYQHDQYFYDLCDKNGMVVWAEIPYISVHMIGGDENALSQMRELVIQNYNHPSIMFIGISNEITIGGESDAQLELHKKLNKLVKELDPTRLTTMACVTMCDTHSPLLDVPDIFSYNHYFGWYIGDVGMNNSWIDDFRAEFPDKPLGISEYGAEGILTWHTSTPKQGDYTEEYQAYYHENLLKTFEARPYLWSTYVWNMFDFGVDSRDEGGVQGRNNKGLVTYDRKTKKDSFYLYKAYWSDQPFVHICGKRYQKRAERETTIKVYSNQPSVSLYVGDKLIETKSGDKVFEFSVPLGLFGTHIKAVAGDVEDTAKFVRVLTPCKHYVLKEKKQNVDNWFEKDGVKYEYKFPEGKFSIRDKFNTIYATEEGEKVLKSLIAEALKSIDPSGDPEKFLKGARKLIGGMTIERIANLAGNRLSKEMLFKVNEELNKIDKPTK